jgi:hypothetical protein
LSYALAGDWAAARTVAAQDVPADQLDARIQQWMKLASPSRASDQVAALTGVTPTVDPGQPVRLALRRDNGTALAEAQPAVPVPGLAPPPAAAQAPAPVQIAQAQPAYVPPFRPEPVEAPAPAAVAAAKLEPVEADQVPFVEVARPAPTVKSAPVRPARKAPPSVRAAAFVPKRVAPRPAALVAHGRSSAVVQIGAYGSPKRVAEAWSRAAKRYVALRNFMPVSARFNSAQGPVYRLSVKGFSSPDQAKSLCVSLRRAGGSCFVRNVAGDAPVQFASR